MLLHGEILGCAQRHIGDKQTLHRRVLSGVHEGHDTVKHAGVGEHVLEIEVVIVGQTHTAQDNLVCLCTQCHVRHHLVVRLVGVSEERNLLSGNEGVVQVNTCDTGSDEFARLLTAHGVHTRTTDLHFLTFHIRSAINRVAVGVEEASCQLVAHFQRRCLAKEHHFCIGGDTLRALEHLQGYIIAHNLNDLSQFAIHGSEFIVTHPFGFQRASCLGDSRNLGVNLLKCLCHSRYPFICFSANRLLSFC